MCSPSIHIIWMAIIKMLSVYKPLQFIRWFIKYFIDCLLIVNY